MKVRLILDLETNVNCISNLFTQLGVVATGDVYQNGRTVDMRYLQEMHPYDHIIADVKERGL